MNLDKPVGKLFRRFQLFMPSVDISKGDRLTPNRVNGHVEQDMYVAKSFQTMTKGCQNPVFSDSFRPSPDLGETSRKTAGSLALFAVSTVAKGVFTVITT